MKGLIVLVILVFIGYCTRAQTIANDDTLVIKTAINQQAGDSILYLRHSVGWISVKDCIKKRKLNGITKATAQNFIELTKEESKYLHHQIKALRDSTWQDHLLSNSTLLADTAIWEYFADAKKQLAERQTNAIANKDWEELRKIQHIINYLYGFSVPIYLRNNTICLLYHQALCGNTCGHNEVAFYKKENGVWAEWIVLGAGDH